MLEINRRNPEDMVFIRNVILGRTPPGWAGRKLLRYGQRIGRKLPESAQRYRNNKFGSLLSLLWHVEGEEGNREKAERRREKAADGEAMSFL